MKKNIIFFVLNVSQIQISIGQFAFTKNNLSSLRRKLFKIFSRLSQPKNLFSRVSFIIEFIRLVRWSGDVILTWVQEVPGSNPDLAQILYFITILFNIHPTIYFLFYTTYETKKVKKNDFFTWLHNQTNFKKSSIDYLGRLPLFATKMNAQRRSFPYRISIVPIHNNGLSLP